MADADLSGYSDADLLAAYEAQSRASIAAPTSNVDLSQFSDADLLAAYQQQQQGGATPNSIAAQIGKGLSFGWFDEIQGAEAGAQNAIANLFGRGTNKSFGETYADKVKSLRAKDAAFETQHPYLSTGLQIAGGVAPALMSGGASTLPNLFGKATGTLFGLGTKAAPTIGQLAKIGAAGGAAYGAGAADEGDRITGALKGGALGAIAAPVIGKVTEKGINTIADIAANKGVLNKLASESGEVLSGIPASEGYTAADLILAKQLKNTPVEKVIEGGLELEKAVLDEVPLFLPEALNSPKVNRNARFIANYDPSLEASQTAINNRTAGASARGSNLLNKISPDEGTFTGASRLAKAADDILKGANEFRQAEAAPLYKVAYTDTPTINSPDLKELITKDQIIANTIKSVKKTAVNADLPDTSSELLVKVRSRLGDEIEAAKTKGSNQLARDLTDTYNRLNNILHTENPLLLVADESYAASSGLIDDLNGTFLKNLSNLSSDKVQNVGQVFGLPAERISKLRTTFDKAGLLDEWNAGIRAHLQNTIDNTPQGKNFADKIIGNSAQKAKLQAALGDSYDEIASGLGLESRMAQGKNQYHAGSSTAGNLSEQQQFQKQVSFIEKVKNSDWLGALTHLFSNNLPDDTAQQLARIYFDPKVGSDRLQKIIPLLKQYAANQTFSGKSGALAGQVAGRSSGAFSAPSNERITGTQQLFGPKKKLDINTKGASMDTPQSKNPQFHPLVDRLASALVKQESGGKADAVSPKGATGLWQIMPATAKDIAKELGVAKYDLKDPKTSELFGKYYLSQMLNRFDGDPKLALAAYNAGPGKVQQWINEYETDDWEEISKKLKAKDAYLETVNYVPSILRRLDKGVVMA